MALHFINKCKLFSETLFTELAHLFGKSLDLLDLTYRSRRYPLKRLFRTLFLALRVNTCLTSLDLKGNSIGAEEANSLTQALTVNTSLTPLDLTLNFIGDEGGYFLSV